jgi:hypothetical protein
MKQVMSSVTAFFKKAFPLIRRDAKPSGFWGHLNRGIVRAEKKVIVFESPRILHSSDSVEEATSFLVKAKDSGKKYEAGIYMHDSKMWYRVDAR